MGNTMLLIVFVVLSVLILAYANGANDNFKGVATLYGSFSAGYRTALAVGTVATFAGGIASLFFATELIKMFSGAGVVPASVAGTPAFVTAVAAAAAGTVILATVLGLPISTTHGLTGAIAGAGFVFVGSDLNLGVIGKSFALPLIVGPIAAVALTIPLYYLLHQVSRRSGITRETCVCLDGASLMPVRHLEPVASGGSVYATAYSVETGNLVTIGHASQCVEKYGNRVMGIRLQQVIDGLHFTSAAAVSFARGLNDTPKILALLLAAQALGINEGVIAVVVAMAIGGILNARKVAQTMSRKISRMNDGQALTANLVTAFLVIVASRLGAPVSTTHVSVGAIAGVGIINGTANRSMITGILASWVATLPIAALLGAALALALR
jgi:PiT family inorganic phosphate transporter